MGVLGAAGAQGSWFCILLGMFVAQGEHSLYQESVRKVPGYHCSQMAAGSLLPCPPGSKPGSWDCKGRDLRFPVIPRHGTKKELGDCRAVTSSPYQRWGRHWQRCCSGGTIQPSPDTLAKRAGGSCLVLEGCFGVLLQGTPRARGSSWAGGDEVAGPASCQGRGPQPVLVSAFVMGGSC